MEHPKDSGDALRMNHCIDEIPYIDRNPYCRDILINTRAIIKFVQQQSRNHAQQVLSPAQLTEIQTFYQGIGKPVDWQQIRSRIRCDKAALGFLNEETQFIVPSHLELPPHMRGRMAQAEIHIPDGPAYHVMPVTSLSGVHHRLMNYFGHLNGIFVPPYRKTGDMPGDEARYAKQIDLLYRELIKHSIWFVGGASQRAEVRVSSIFLPNGKELELSQDLEGFLYTYLMAVLEPFIPDSEHIEGLKINVLTNFSMRWYRRSFDQIMAFAQSMKTVSERSRKKAEDAERLALSRTVVTAVESSDTR